MGAISHEGSIIPRFTFLIKNEAYSGIARSRHYRDLRASVFHRKSVVLLANESRIYAAASARTPAMQLCEQGRIGLRYHPGRRIQVVCRFSIDREHS
jgi:hypothetical protein